METILAETNHEMGFESSDSKRPTNATSETHTPADREFAAPTSSLAIPSGPIRLGAVEYLNTKPLIYGMHDALDTDGLLSLALPSRLADQLHAGEIDIGLIPVAEYFQKADQYVPVSNAVIACDGPVWSVRVFFRKPLDQVRLIAVDDGSRTSIALTKVLFQSLTGKIPPSISLPIGVDPREIDADAFLIIGDRAMQPDKQASDFLENWDLGELWKKQTGLPFVFAMWVARDRTFASRGIAELLESCRDRGCQHVDEIASAAAGRYGLSRGLCRDYLSHYIRYYLGERETRGLREFHRRCVELELAPRFTLPF